jgi:hypothetical protein
MEQMPILCRCEFAAVANKSQSPLGGEVFVDFDGEGSFHLRGAAGVLSEIGKHREPLAALRAVLEMLRFVGCEWGAIPDQRPDSVGM